MKMRRFAQILSLAAALALGASGCSFLFDFTECEADGDCQQFDHPAEGEFFVCSADNKCVIEPERQCRTDAHCPDGQTCQQDPGTCSE